MKKCIMLFSIVTGSVVASDSRLTACGIQHYDKSFMSSELSGSQTLSDLGYSLLIGDNHSKDWVEHFKNNPQEYLNVNPENNHELYHRLKEEDENLSEKKFFEGNKQIIKYYTQELKSFEKKFRCSANNVVGYGASIATCIVSNAAVFLYAPLHCPGVECSDQAETLGISIATMVIGDFVFTSGLLLTLWRHERQMHAELHNRQDKRLSAMYEVVVNRLGLWKKIGW